MELVPAPVLDGWLASPVRQAIRKAGRSKPPPPGVARLVRLSVNQENAVRAMVLEALRTGKEIVLDVPLVSAVEMLPYAESVKAEHPKLYGRVKVWKARPNRLAFELSADEPE